MTESARLAALHSYRILDTAPEAAFDRLAALAADLFDAPIALVSLVDEHRQWFKSRHGMPLAETPRSQAFCDHTIRVPESAVMVVEDARLDARFASNPLVTPEGGLRFYAGAKLTTPGGLHIGSLCVADRVPRARPSERDLQRLVTLAGLVVDEFELRRVARQVNEANQLLAMAETMAHVGSWRFMPATGQIVWSDEVYRIHGVERASFDPELDSAVDFYHPDDRAAVSHSLQRAAETGEGFSFQLRLIRADGALRHVVCKADAERDETGAVCALIGVFQDVTDQVAARIAAEESEAKYKALADNSHDILIRFGRDGIVSYASPACRRLEFEPEEVVGMNVLTFVAPDHVAYSQAVVDQLFSGADIDRTKRREHRIVTKSGRVMWLEGNPTLLRDARGEIFEVLSVLRDVTESRAANEALAASQARYKTLADTAPDLIAESRIDGTVIYVSPAAFKITGRTSEELLGRTSYSWMHPDDAPRVLEMCRAVFYGKGKVEPWTVEYRSRHKDGHEIWLESKPTPVMDEATGRITGFTDVIHDITAHKRLEADLAAARVEAEAAAAVKSEFMANMSHEIRTPLTAVLGFSKLVAERNDLPEEAANHAQRVVVAGKALLATVNDILDFSKLEAGQVDFRPTPVAPKELLAETLGLFDEIARAKGLTVVLKADQLPAMLMLDSDRVRQVLLNYVGNAMKFTETGEVELRADFTAEGRFFVAVRDTGPGVPEDKLAKLFQRFSQVDGGSTRKHGGTGLGLAICKGLVEAMGGEVGVESAGGHGSTFWFAIPAARVAPALAEPVAASQGPAQRLKGMRLLVADDNALNRRVVTAFLGPLGVELTEVADGAAAIAMAADNPFDAILMDLRMPGLSGADTARAIREAGGPNADVPILAFSADAFPTLPPGLFDGLITKPIAIQPLVETLSRAFGLNEEAPSRVVA